jgi:hypothetical protein
MVFSLMGYLAFKSDAMAANLASGSTNLGTSDVASAAAMGAAAGAAVATGGASAVAGAAKGGQSMGDIMKSLAGSGGGTVSNASTSGAGPAPVGPAPLKPSMSMGVSGPSAVNKPPARPAPVNAGSNAQSKPGATTSASTPSSSGGSEANAGIGAPHYPEVLGEHGSHFVDILPLGIHTLALSAEIGARYHVLTPPASIYRPSAGSPFVSRAPLAETFDCNTRCTASTMGLLRDI